MYNNLAEKWAKEMVDKGWKDLLELTDYGICKIKVGESVITTSNPDHFRNLVESYEADKISQDKVLEIAAILKRTAVLDIPAPTFLGDRIVYRNIYVGMDLDDHYIRYTIEYPAEYDCDYHGTFPYSIETLLWLLRSFGEKDEKSESDS